MEYLLGIDIGTSGTKSVIFTCDGGIVASASEEYGITQKFNGWAEQDPDLWWNASKNTCRAAIEKAGIDPRSILGVSLSGQMHGLVLLGENGNVVYPALIWCDGRTQKQCDYITETVGFDKLMKITANPALTGFTACKVLWVKENEPEVWAKVKHMMLPKDYVRYRLTGEITQEISDGSATNLFDLENRVWSKEIFDKLELDISLMPPLVGSTEVSGRVTPRASEETGLSVGTPVTGGAGDNMAAAVGIGVVEEGKVFTTIGTSGVVYTHSDKLHIEPEGRVHAFCSAVPGAYVNFGASLSAGLSLKWFKNTFCESEIAAAECLGIDVYDLMTKEAAQSPIGANRLLFLPYLMGERSPLLDSYARGCFFGLSAMHTRSDLIRAVLEGVMYSQRHILDVERSMGIEPKEMLACGGGAKSGFWRQMMSDLYNLPVSTVFCPESPALGAAIMAGVGVGVWKDLPSACAAMVKTKDRILPDADRHEQYEKFYQFYVSLYPNIKESCRALAQL